MVKLENVIFCMHAESVSGRGVTAETILATLFPDYIPGLFTFSVILIILGLDPQADHSFKAEFWSPSGECVVNIGGPFSIPNPDLSIPQEYQGVNLAMNWNNTNLRSSGVYKLKVWVDNKLIGEKDIFVKGKNEL